MTNPVLEDDVVERLHRIDEEAMYRMPATTFTAVQDAIRTIERLQKELGEAREREDQMRDACKYYADSDRSEMDTIRQQTIEKCAKVAEDYARITYSNHARSTAETIAKAIRSMDGGGK